jgi:uncharacterized membrane protein YeaQ/YmgE (transglycosylase-associated protein family)
MVDKLTLKRLLRGRVAQIIVAAVAGTIVGLIAFSITRVTGRNLFLITGAIAGIVSAFVLRLYRAAAQLSEVKVTIPQFSELRLTTLITSRLEFWLRVRWAGAMVVLISPETRAHPWVDWEIEYAHKSGARIVGVWTHGAGECDVPDALEEYADAVVGWQAGRINGAICGDINNWETSDGKIRAPWEIKKVSC